MADRGGSYEKIKGVRKRVGGTNPPPSVNDKAVVKPNPKQKPVNTGATEAKADAV